MSVSSFNRIFKKEMNLTPIKYLIEIRIEKSKTLEGIIFHTASTKDVFAQIQNNPKVELCFKGNGSQIRVAGVLEHIEDEILQLLTQSPKNFKAYRIWDVIWKLIVLCSHSFSFDI